MGYRRRTVLRGIGLAGVGTAAATAGCLDGVLSGVRGQPYTTWVPSPDELAMVERFNFLRVSPPSVHDAAVVPKPVETRFRAPVRHLLDVLGIAFEDVAGLIWIGHFAVVLDGSFRVERIEDRLYSRNFRALGSHEEYSLYAAEETLVAVASDAVVVGPWAGTGTASIVTAVVDAKAGSRNRYVAADDAFADLTEALGEGDLVVGQTDPAVAPVPNVEATGTAWRFDETVAKVTFAFVFRDGSAVDTAAVESLADSDAMADYRDLDVGTRGRVGILTGTVPAVTDATLRPFPAIEDAIETRPTATFEVSYGSQQRTATVVHAGGDAIPRSRLRFQGDGFRSDPDVDQDEPGRWAGDAAGSTAAVEPGDSVTIGIYPDAHLVLRYRPIGRGEGVTLRTFEPA